MARSSDRDVRGSRAPARDGNGPVRERRDGPDERPDDGGFVRHGQYTIYKPVKSGKGGALRFELNPEMPAVFVEGARQEEGKLRRFAWASKITMKWGLSDVGEALAALERRQPAAKLYHQTEKMNTAFELKYQADRRPANYYATISRQREETKEVERLGVSVSPGEAAVLAALLRHAAVVLAGWDAGPAR